MNELRRVRKVTLRGVQPSAGIRAAYQKRLIRLIDDMTKSAEYWARQSWRSAMATDAMMAVDETPADEMQRQVYELASRWNRNFDQSALGLAKWFSTKVEKRSSQQLALILRDAGFAVDFKMTEGMRDVLRATVEANAGLIKSIPQQYMLQVQGILMRGAQSGRDLKSVTDALEKQAGVTRRRASFIARDQSNKATASFTRARQLEIGITEAIWVHSAGGHEPRPTHVEAGRNRVKFDVAKGWYDPAVKEYIQPGELINCRCFSRPVVTGFEP